jgi:hypothetical protein
MNEVNEHQNTEDGAGLEPEMPHLPDGIGICLEDLEVLLAMKRDNHLGIHDPVLMIVTVCNAFLEAVQTLQQKHNNALTSILTARTKEYVASVQNTTDALTKTLSEASVEAIRQIFSEHASTLQAFKRNARWCAFIVAVSTAANIITLALR